MLTEVQIMQTARGLVLALCFYGSVQGIFWIMDYLDRNVKK